ncbi:MAG: family transposase, partial [Rhodospirillales bacterium]|nr:family transposase [Rhodospirillales bacterium]
MSCEKNGEAALRRDVVGVLRGTYRISERRACFAMGFQRSVQRYSSRSDPQVELRMRLRDLAAARAATATGGCTCCCGG